MQQTFGQKIFNNLLGLLADNNFRNEIISIKEKFGIPDGGVDDDFINEQGSSIIGQCAEELEKFRVKHKLNEHYGIFLMFVVIFAKRPDKIILQNTLPFELITHQEKSGLNCAAIKIYPETTIEDIKKNWLQIRKFRKGIYGYEIMNQRPVKNAWRDLNIRAMKRWGMNNKAIVAMINDIYPQSRQLGYADISKIIDKNKRSANKKLKITPKIK